MIKYVVGFLFDSSMQDVLLIEKQKPDWQKGMLNGVGGKIENYDLSPHDAMVREFTEEAGVEILDWRRIAFTQNYNPDYELTFFSSVSDKIYDCKPTTIERLQIVKVSELHGYERILAPSLIWLVPLSLSNIPTVNWVAYNNN